MQQTFQRGCSTRIMYLVPCITHNILEYNTIHGTGAVPLLIEAPLHKAPTASTLLELQSRFGDEPLGIRVDCPKNGTAVLKGL